MQHLNLRRPLVSHGCGLAIALGLIAIGCADGERLIEPDAASMDAGMDARVDATGLDANDMDVGAIDASRDVTSDTATHDASRDVPLDASLDVEQVPLVEPPCVEDTHEVTDEDAGSSATFVYRIADPVPAPCAPLAAFVQATPGANLLGFVPYRSRDWITGVAVNGDQILWTGGKSAHRYHTHKAGGVVMERYDFYGIDGIEWASAPVVVGCHVYWSASGDGEPAVLRDGFHLDPPGYIHNQEEVGTSMLYVDESYVYSTEESTGLYGVPHAGGSRVERAVFSTENYYSIAWVAATADKVIWGHGDVPGSQTTTRLRWRRKDRRGPEVDVTAAFEDVRAAVADADAVFLVEERATSWAIVRLSVDPETVTTLTTLAIDDPLRPRVARWSANPPTFRIDGDYLVWFTADPTDGRIVRMRKDGTEPPAVWLANVEQSHSLALDASSLYWVASCVDQGDFVVRVPRPAP